MKIGLDIMGGDYAPRATVLGAVEASKILSDNQHIVLIGNKELALPILEEANVDPSIFEFVHTTETIGMGEHPTKAITQKTKCQHYLRFSIIKRRAD